MYMAGGVRSQAWGLLADARRVYENHRREGDDRSVDLVIPKNIVKARRMKWHSAPPVTLVAAIEAQTQWSDEELIRMKEWYEHQLELGRAAGW